MRTIEQWRSLDLRRMSPDQVVGQMNLLSTLLGEHTTQSRHSTGFELWRARVDKEVLHAECEEALWEPPSERTTPRRCNVARSPVLYCARHAATALDECGAVPGSVALLIKYWGEDIRVAHVIGDFHPKDINDKPIFDREGLLAYQILREFIRSEFTKPVGSETEFLYQISYAICQVWRSGETYDGWAYPSVFRVNAENVALKPSSAHSKLAIREVLRAKVVNIGHPSVRFGENIMVVDGIEIEVMEVGTVFNGRIKWKNAPKGARRIFSRQFNK